MLLLIGRFWVENGLEEVGTFAFSADKLGGEECGMDMWEIMIFVVDVHSRDGARGRRRWKLRTSGWRCKVRRETKRRELIVRKPIWKDDDVLGRWGRRCSIRLLLLLLFIDSLFSLCLAKTFLEMPEDSRCVREFRAWFSAATVFFKDAVCA